MNSTKRALCGVFAAVLALAACGGGDGDDAGTDLGGKDVPSVDVQDPGTPDDPGTRDEAPDGLDVGTDSPDEGRDGTTEEDVPDVPLCPGGYLCECESGAECYSGFCVDDGDGKVCTRQCSDDDSCPQGWSCEQVASSPDVMFACVNLNTQLCKPCRKDADCSPALGAGSLRFVCLSHGDEGSFCGAPCSGADDCPEDYACETTGEGATASKQCVREAGTCPCTAAFQQGGFTTDCRVRAGDWACRGERTCATECDAPTPVAETCNHVDDNCDGETDEGLDDLPCDLANEHGTCTGKTRCALGESSCEGTAPAREACNGKDDNCDGGTDEADAAGCTKYYRDDDRDKYGQTDDFQCLCAAAAPYDTQQGGDCNDGDAAVKPTASETCNGKDDNCNDQTDEPGSLSCIPHYRDDDTDGFGVESDSQCLCGPAAPYSARKFGDCNDGDALVKPTAAESCNGVDDNCANGVDEDGAEGCQAVYRDVDRDGFGLSTQTACKCVPAAPWDAPVGGDCNDDEPAVKPGVAEACNGVDDNCNTQIDEVDAVGCETYYLDQDGDTFGQDYKTRCLCAPDPVAKFTATRGEDCNDNDSAVKPGAREFCNGKDDNCALGIDEMDAEGCKSYSVDTDGDGWGVFGTGLCLCAPHAASFRTALREGDCDDTANAVNPDAREKCNGFDDNCKEGVDEENAQGCVVYYRDRDNDGQGATADAKCFCGAVGEYKTTVPDDCCDTDARVWKDYLKDGVPQTNATFQETISNCATWDFNCNGADQKEELRVNGGCDSWNPISTGCGLQRGWEGSAAPACGVRMNFVDGGCGYSGFPYLECDNPDRIARTQKCL